MSTMRKIMTWKMKKIWEMIMSHDDHADRKRVAIVIADGRALRIDKNGNKITGRVFTAEDMSVKIGFSKPVTPSRLAAIAQRFDIKHKIEIRDYRYSDPDTGMEFSEEEKNAFESSGRSDAYKQDEVEYHYDVACNSLVIFKNDTPVYANDNGFICRDSDAIYDCFNDGNDKKISPNDFVFNDDVPDVWKDFGVVIPFEEPEPMTEAAKQAAIDLVKSKRIHDAWNRFNHPMDLDDFSEVPEHERTSALEVVKMTLDEYVDSLQEKFDESHVGNKHFLKREYGIRVSDMNELIDRASALDSVETLMEALRHVDPKDAFAECTTPMTTFVGDLSHVSDSDVKDMFSGVGTKLSPFTSDTSPLSDNDWVDMFKGCEAAGREEVEKDDDFSM